MICFKIADVAMSFTLCRNAMVSSEENSFERFAQANAPHRFTEIDYVHAIYKGLKLPSDFVLSFSKLFWPRFLIVDEHVFVADLFEARRYQDLRNSGHGVSSAQFWTNLLEVTGLFDEMPFPQVLELAQTLVTAWNAKIENECTGAAGRARLIHDTTTGEIFVVIGSAP